MATRTLKGGANQSPVIRSKSTNNASPKQHARTQKVKSSPVYHATSETSLTKGLRNLSINDNKELKNGSTVSVRRFRSAGSKHQCLELIAKDIQEKRIKNVVVMAGAGISTPSGIPDFRTPGTGLYDNLQQYKIPYPQAIFDIDYFEQNPRPFFTLARELYPNGKYRPNYVHYFMKLLEEKGILQKVYTQNIDGLERMAGVSPTKIVEAHGTFSSATCTKCRLSQNTEDLKKTIFEKKIPRCRKKDCHGVVKPDIVFFGEDLPRKFFYYLRDFPQADLLLVMGTSLAVEPFAGIVDAVRLYVPRVLFNREAVGPFVKKRRMNDVVIAGDMIDSVQKLVLALGWQKELKDMIISAEGSFKEAWVIPDHVPDKSTNQNSEDHLLQDSSSSDDDSENGSSIRRTVRNAGRRRESPKLPYKNSSPLRNQSVTPQQRQSSSRPNKWASKPPRKKDSKLGAPSPSSSQQRTANKQAGSKNSPSATPVVKPPLHPQTQLTRKNMHTKTQLLSTMPNNSVRFRHDSPLGEYQTRGKELPKVDFRHRLQQILSVPKGQMSKTRADDSSSDSESESSSDET